MDRVGQHASVAQNFGEPRSALVEIPPPASSRGVAVPRIVAYGDSLTAGFPSCVTYAEALSQALADAGHPVEIHVCGMCGSTAEQMASGINEPLLADRIGRSGVGLAQMVRERHRGGSWRAADLALIMAGTNDLASPTPGELIANYVKDLHVACHELGVRTVALSIPDQGIRRYKRLKASGRVASERDIQKEIQLERHHNDEQLFKATRRKRANAVLADWANGRSGGAAPVPPEQPADKPVASLEAYLKALELEEEGAGESGEVVPSLEACLAQVDEDGARDALERPELFVSVGSILPHGPRAVAAGYWESDAVHFTKEGSRVIGRRLAVLLQPLVQRISAARLLGHGGEELTTSGDDAAPSLEAFMEAFRLEDELGSAGGAMSGKAQLLEEMTVEPREWEEEAAVRLQRFVRSRCGRRR